MSLLDYKSYDELLADILTDMQGAKQSPIVQGDDLYAEAVALASQVWGLRVQAGWTLDQIWPGSASQPNLVRHASPYGLSLSGDDYAGLLARLEARLRAPAAGGNVVDFEVWTLDFEHAGESCSSVKVYANGYGPGTVVVVVSNASDPQPSPAFCEALTLWLRDEKGPIVPAAVFVMTALPLSVAVSITMLGGDAEEARRLIMDYMASVQLGQTIHPAAWTSFCWQAGATAVTLNAPPLSPLIPNKFQNVAISSLAIGTT